MTKILKTTASKIPSFILRIGKVLQFISPYLAASYAHRLFKSPIRHQMPEREKMMAKSAQSEMHDIQSINKKVMVYTYGYSKKKVLLLHGWSGRGTQLFAIADKLLENGFMTYSFDGPAHGKSTGRTTIMTEFMETALYLDKKYGPFELAIGHSLGGMAILNGAAKGLRAKKLVSISAGDKISDIIFDFIKTLQLKPRVGKIIIHKLIRKFKENIDNYASSSAAPKILQPTLIVHDSNDKEIPVSCAISIRQNLKSGHLLITKELGHRRILNDGQIVKRIVEFANIEITDQP